MTDAPIDPNNPPFGFPVLSSTGLLQIRASNIPIIGNTLASKKIYGQKTIQFRVGEPGDQIVITIGADNAQWTVYLDPNASFVAPPGRLLEAPSGQNIVNLVRYIDPGARIDEDPTSPTFRQRVRWNEVVITIIGSRVASTSGYFPGDEYHIRRLGPLRPPNSAPGIVWNFAAYINRPFLDGTRSPVMGSGIVAQTRVVATPGMTNLNRNANQNLIIQKHLCGSTNTNHSQKVAGPQVFIQARLRVDQTDIADALFVICDELTYYGQKPISHQGQCVERLIDMSKIKKTQFQICCPYIVSVLKGDGQTVLTKIESIADQNGIENTIEFTLNVILYAMVKYILARVLYGKFNIKFLLEKYHEQFLKDLYGSRFCGARQFFEDASRVGFEKYFKFDKH